jgi:hypothetical protein
MSKNTQISELINYISVDGSGNVVFTSVPSAVSNTDKFLVSDSGVLKYRTAAQLLSDIGAQASGNYQTALTNPVTGTGTANYLPKFIGSTSIANSLIFDNGTNVLIGTTTAPTPVAGVSFPLSVTSSAVTRIRIDSTQATPNAGFGLYANSVQKWSIAMFGTGSDFTIYNDALLASAILVKGASSNVLVGYGTSTADTGYKLDVNGTARFNNTLNGTIANFVNAFTDTINITSTAAGTTKGHIGQFADSLYISNNYFYNGAQSFDDTSKANSSIEFAAGSLLLKTGAANTVPGTKLTISSTGAATFSSSVTSLVNNISADGAGVVLQGYVDNILRIAVRGSGYNDGARGGLYASIGDFSSTLSVTGDSTFTGVSNFNNEVRAGAYALSSLNYIDGTAVPLSTRRFRASQSRTNNDNGAVGLDLTNLQSTNGVYSPIISFSSTTSGGVYNCTYAAIWGVKTSDEGSWAAGDLILGTANPYGVTSRLRITAAGAATFSSSVTTGGNINVNSDGIFINRSSSGEPYVFFQKNGVNRGSIYGVTGGGLRVFDESDNQVLTITGTRLGISDASPSRKLTVNFGTSTNDGLIVYGSQRQNTIFQSTGEHCFIYIDSHHANTFLPRVHFQRSSTTYGDIGLERASNSDAIGSYAESEMVVGTSTSVPFSLKTNSQRRIRINSGGSVEVFNTVSISNNLTARNFNKYIKTWSPAGSTGSYTTVTYNWADELASVASSFDSAGYYKGFIRSANGAHYNGYHFDILVGQIGYGGNSLQFKVQNITPAHSPWVGGCGPSPFGTVDNTIFEHRNNPCGEALELFITKLGG